MQGKNIFSSVIKFKCSIYNKSNNLNQLFYIIYHIFRFDIYTKVGLQPSRQSASTQAVSTSSSSSLGSLVRSGQSTGHTEYGMEQEVITRILFIV